MQPTPQTKLLRPGGDSSSLKEKPRNNADPFVAVRGMSYDAMKAYFYDMKTSEDKGKGKAN